MSGSNALLNLENFPRELKWANIHTWEGVFKIQIIKCKSSDAIRHQKHIVMVGVDELYIFNITWIRERKRDVEDLSGVIHIVDTDGTIALKWSIGSH